MIRATMKGCEIIAVKYSPQKNQMRAFTDDITQN